MVARGVEERFDAFRFGLKRRLGLLDPFEILPYLGHGTTRELFLRGRVLEETGITRAGRDDAVWKNILNMARRFASDEVAGARVRASFEGLHVEPTADVEGFFEVRFQLAEPLDELQQLDGRAVVLQTLRVQRPTVVFSGNQPW